MDLVVVTDDVPKSGETITGRSFFTNPGGKGANQAVAIAKMGGCVEMVGVLGNEFRNELLDALLPLNVSTNFIRHNQHINTGTATIIVSNGDNRIIINPGANYSINEQDVDAALANAQKGDYLVCQLEIPVEIVEYALRQAKVKGMITFLNPAPANRLNEKMFNFVDYIIPNQTEAEFYTGFYPHNNETALHVANKFMEFGVGNVLITMGEKGAFFANKNENHYKAGYQVVALDTTGAGDTYIGTFVTMLAEGKGIEASMGFANLAASITVQRFGAQKSIPFRKELEQHNI